MNLFQTLILSVVEGITEFLPISSTGHLILTTTILHIPETEFVKSFMILIQLGAILAVVILYYKKLLNKELWPKILVAFIPSAIIGFVLYHFIKQYLLSNALVTVIALFIGGIAFILVELWSKNRLEDKVEKNVESITLKHSFIIGLFQSISIIPGTSRAGSTIIGGLILGINRKAAAEFSFLLAIPTMLAASTLDIIETKLAFTQNEILLLIIGFIVSFIVALITVKLFIKYLSNHTFIPFGVYRIVIAIIFYLVYLR